MSRTRTSSAAILALMLASVAMPATAEDWELSHGPFTTEADVRPHNALPQDIADILAALDAEPPEWGEALEIFAFGRNFPWREQIHSIGRFTDDYNGAMPRVVPLSVGFFGDGTFQKDFLFSALAGTGQFQGAPAEVRRAAFEVGAVAAVANWTRFELVMSEAKALADEPNWALTNGSPKNWMRSSPSTGAPKASTRSTTPSPGSTAAPRRTRPCSWRSPRARSRFCARNGPPRRRPRWRRSSTAARCSSSMTPSHARPTRRVRLGPRKEEVLRALAEDAVDNLKRI